jgi:hypothetical protein
MKKGYVVRLQIHRSSQNKTAQGTSPGPSSFYFFQRELSGIPTEIKSTSESPNRQAKIERGHFNFGLAAILE